MISQSQYVAITSGVGGAAQVSNREQILRVFTTSAKMPTGNVLEFTSVESVGNYFGFNSQEYAIAQSYFGYVNNYQQSPSKLSFYADISQGKAPFLWGTQAPAALTQFTTISDGSFVLSMGGITETISGLSFSSASSYTQIAETIQTAIQQAQSSNDLWSQSTFVYDSETSSFVLTGGAAEEATIVALSSPEGGTDISGLLGLNQAASPTVSQGVAAASYSQMLSDSLNMSNNYGTFTFLSTPDNDSVVEIAQWTQAQNLVGGMYIQPCALAQYNTLQPLVADYAGVALVADSFTPFSLAWLVPACVAASTNYNRINGTQNYMYKQLAGVEPSVTTDANYEALTAVNVNFYGSTQQAGTPISFFQPGKLQGEIEDMGVYMNELWLKDANTVSFLNYQLAVSKWPANEAGRAIGDGLVQQNIEIAKKNGTILQGKELTSTQKAYITSLTGDDQAWRSVYSEGNYLMSAIVPVTSNGNTVYEYQYTLIYSKGDSVRKVTGTHTLI